MLSPMVALKYDTNFTGMCTLLDAETNSGDLVISSNVPTDNINDALRGSTETYEVHLLIICCYEFFFIFEYIIQCL